MAKKILLVDDDSDLVASLSQALMMNGYDVSIANSGAEGLVKLLEVRPDLMILDVMMETDTAGFEITYQIRSQRPTSRYKDVRETPIVMLTAINQVTNSRFSLSEGQSFLPGVNDFLTKPVKIDELLGKVKKLL
ncbi:MAG TPA: response regulator [Spirochaetota bacterium]|nr:response regulator [Spirochaetota bacterium]